MSALPKISVITVVYNGAQTLRGTLESIRLQNYPNLEYWIIDGGSTDSTLEIIKEYQDLIHGIVSEKDQGIYDAMNKGLNLATGDLVAFLNADDSYAAGALMAIAQAAIQNPSQILYGRLGQKLRSGEIRWNCPPSPQELSSKRPKAMLVGHPTLFVGRELALQVGLYNLKYRLAADYDWFQRLYTLCPPPKNWFFVDHPTTFFDETGATSKALDRSLRETMEVNLGLGISPWRAKLEYHYRISRIRLSNWWRHP
jgi:glycosyltransferase involved in cell wall biosynthesis